MSIYYSIRNYLDEHPEAITVWDQEAHKRKYITLPTQEELAREYQAVTGMEYQHPKPEPKQVYKPELPNWVYTTLREHYPDRTEEEHQAWEQWLPDTIKSLAVSVSDTMDFITTAIERGNIPLAMAYWHHMKFTAD